LRDKEGIALEPYEFMQRQSLPYKAKIIHATMIAHQFEDWAIEHGHDICVSVGGLDSITLYYFLESIGIHATPVSVSNIEDKSNQEIHKQIPGMVFIKPYKSKVEVIREFGFPVISKEKAGKIQMLQRPSEKNATVRHAIMTGECGELGKFKTIKTGSRMRLPQKWLNLFGGPENEAYGTHYQTAPFRVSPDCCYWMKEKPVHDWQKANNMIPYLGLMASEGGQREKSLTRNGCNYFGKTVVRSCPFAIFNRQDILQLALDLNVPVPKIYGEIVRDSNGELRTTRAQRTGCSMCGFGIHIEKRPHRFDRLREDNLKEWEFWMYKCMKDKDDRLYGWGEVLDYIGIGWEDIVEEYTQTELFG
jgi:hypothetical protein